MRGLRREVIAHEAAVPTVTSAGNPRSDIAGALAALIDSQNRNAMVVRRCIAVQTVCFLILAALLIWRIAA